MEHLGDLEDVVDSRIKLGFLGTCFLLGLVINIPATIIYAKTRQLRGFTDKFILYVVIVDVLSLLTFIPVSFVLVLESSYNGSGHRVETHVDEERPLFVESENVYKGSESSFTDSDSNFPTFCVQQWILLVHKVVFATTANLSTLGALKIAVERYLAVIAPLHYHKILKSSVVLCLSFFSFALSLVCGLASSYAEFATTSSSLFLSQCAPSREEAKASLLDSEYDDYSIPLKPFQQPHHSEESLSLGSTSLWWPVLTLAHATVFFILPLILITFMYLRIWMEARKHHARMVHRNKSPFIHPGGTKKPEISTANLQSIVGKFKLVQRLRRRPRMDRAARVAIFSIGLLTFCFGPMYLAKIISAISTITNSLKEPESGVASLGGKYLFGTFVACLHPLLSPLFYIYRYKKVQSELIALFKKLISIVRCDCCRQGDTMTSPNILHQINQIAEKLPSSSTAASEQIRESQTVSNTDSDITITIDLQSNTLPENVVDSAEFDPDYETFRPFSSDLEDDTTRDTDYVESQECESHPQESSNHSNNGLLHIINSWMHSYSRRWNQHRESVTSTASVITLLSNHGRSNPLTESP